MTSASRGRVRTMARVSGMVALTKRTRLSRTWGTPMVISPWAVWTGRGRLPLREPAAVADRS